MFEANRHGGRLGVPVRRFAILNRQPQPTQGSVRSKSANCEDLGALFRALARRSRRSGWAPILVIQHVTRVVAPAQIDPCIAFYEILGFRPVEAPPGVAGRAIWLEEGSAPSHVHLMWSDDARPDPGHFALVLPDYEATLDRLRSAGHEVDRRREHWGSPRAYATDPAGNLVELMAWPPPAVLPRPRIASSSWTSLKSAGWRLCSRA
jgi:catechol 2,3-dioxygenase-like lactoylglutathione lyase family enzyme